MSIAQIHRHDDAQVIEHRHGGHQHRDDGQHAAGLHQHRPALLDQPGDQVGAASGSEGHHDLHGLRRVVRLRQSDAGLEISQIDLTVRGRVPGIDQGQFAEHAATAKADCAVSKALAGVGEITLGGYLERNVRIWLDAERLDEKGLTVSDVISALQREHVEVPAGRMETEGREVNVRVLGEAVEQLLAFAEEHPEAAVVGPKLLNPDGTLQRSVRGFPTVWRIATEYLFLRKLAPRSRALNAFYGAAFDHESVREAEFLGGACLLVRREAFEAVGGFDEDFFMMSEEVDWCFRFRKAGWKVLFYPGVEVVHVLSSSANPAMFRELVRGHLRFLWKHRGAREAERARRLMLVALTLRGLAFRGDRGRAYRDAARWLRSGRTAALLESRE